MPELTRSPGHSDSLSNLSDSELQTSFKWQEKRHLLDTSDLDPRDLDCVYAVASRLKQALLTGGQTVPQLPGRIIANVFYENSTRTRASFEMAAKRLGCDVLNLDTKVSSVTKGETIVDTARQLVCMNVSAIVQRHSAAGSAHLVARNFGDKVHVINAGDGWHAHPTQALLDYFTMREIRPNLKGAKVTIAGDVLHSRVARSNILTLKAAGASVHVCAPPTLLPGYLDTLEVTTHTRLEPAIEGADFIMALRIQLERQQQGLIPSLGEYRKLYRLDHARLRLAKPDVKVLHPGPVNRGVELSDELVDDPKISLIETQVANGVPVRMAVLYLLLAGGT